jgi:two-component system, cell cycle sensor histidine kinase and response regulator CckA
LSPRPTSIRASFQFKIFSIFTILSFLTSCLFITLHTIDKARETRRHCSQEIQLLARQLAGSIRLPLYAEDREALKEFASRTGATPMVQRVTITAIDGRILADFAAGLGSKGGEAIGVTAQVLTLPAEIPGMAEAEKPAAVRIGTVHIDRGTEDITHAMHRDIWISSLVALLFWLAVSGLSFLVLKRVTRSFDALVLGVGAMKEGDYATRIPVLSGDEPGRVALAINALAESLQRRDELNDALKKELIESVETEVRARKELAAVNRSLALENLERLQAEQAARQSEQTLRAMMDIMPVGVVLTRQDGSVEYLNQFLVESFGYGREEIPTLDAWFSLAFPDPAYRAGRGEARREALELSRNGEAKPYEARVTCKGGEIRHVLFSNQAQGDRGIVVVVDITDRELMQEQLNKVQKLESLGVLAGGIAHNFNNALTGVMGFISLTRGTLDELHGGHNYLKMAEKASLRAAGMAKQLLTFASGGAPIKKSISIAKVVDEVVSLALNGSNVRCDLEIPPSLPPVRADEGQIVQALSNILINAMQAMPEGGVIGIRVEAAAESCREQSHAGGAGYVTIVISDQGEGIPEANLPKIFDPYFSTKKENTGLGLASVHSIVYRHGGHVSVTSRVGKGTTFMICLPSTREPTLSCKESTLPSGGGPPAGGEVLVMDDDATVRELSGKMLGFLGYRGLACADGKEAVALYRSRREEGKRLLAVILDLTVPGGMGGVEAAKEILALDPEANLIVSSGYSYNPVMAQYRRHGFRAAVAKPYKVEELGHELSLLH